MRALIFWSIIIPIFLWTITNPFVGVLSYSILNLVRPEMFFWGGGAGAKSLIVLFGASLIGVIFAFKNLRNEDETGKIICREIVLWAFIYFAFLMLMPFSNYDVEYSYRYVHEIGKNSLFVFLLFLTLTSFKKIVQYEIGLLCALTFLGLWGIEQHFGGNVRLEGLGGDSWGDSNGVAAIFVLFAPVALSFTEKCHTKMVRIFAVISFVIMLCLIVFTESRGGFLGLVIVLCVYWLKSQKKVSLLLVALVVALLALPLVSQEYWDRIETIGGDSETGERGASSNSRLVFWECGLMLFVENPFTGVGFGAFPEAKLQYASYFDYLDEMFVDEFFRADIPYVTHSTYIQILSEGGLLVIVPFLLIIFLTLYSNWRIRSSTPRTAGNTKYLSLLNGIDIGILGYCVCIVFINSIVFIFFPVQTIVCSKIRQQLLLADDAKHE